MSGFLLIAAGGRPLTLLLLAEHLLDPPGAALRLDAVFPQELLERSGGAECLHADNAARLAHIALPAESGGLLHRHARGDLRRQHARPVRLALILKNIPGRHRNHARADALSGELLVRLDTQADLAPRRDEDHVGFSARRTCHHTGAP